MDNTKIGKERENSYQKMKRSLGKRQKQTHGSLIEKFQQSRKTSVTVKTFQLSFRVFVCVFCLEINNFFLFPFLFFVSKYDFYLFRVAEVLY